MKLQRLIFFAFALLVVPFVSFSAAPAPPLILKGNTATNAPADVSGGTNAGTNAITSSKGATNAGARLSSPVKDVIQMADSGVTPEVLTSYIKTSSSSFNLTTDNIIYLKDIGFSGDLIGAMLAHDKAMRENAFSNPQSMPGESGPPPGSQSPGGLQNQPQPYPDNNNPVPQYLNYNPQQTNFFSDYLSPYGTWGSLPGYGSFWQPFAAATPGWAPYVDNGQWYYSNVGWFWNSNYAWGWGPFHYGRWWNHPTEGWIWFPGTQWAPSWVNWRTSRNFAGWAPLSPFADPTFGFSGGSGAATIPVGFDRFGLNRQNFTFVPMSRLGDRNLSRFRLNPSQVQSIFPQTTLVGNTFATGAGNSVLNRGVDPNLVQAASGSPIPRINVEDPALDFSGLQADTTLADNSVVGGGGSFGLVDDSFGFGTADSFQEAALIQSGLANGPPPSTAQSARINPRFPQPGQGLLDTGQPSTAQSQTINPAFPNLRPGPQLPNVPVTGGGFPARGFFLAPFRSGTGTVPNRPRITRPAQTTGSGVSGPFAPAVGGTPSSRGGPFAPAVGAPPAARGGAFAPAAGGGGGHP